MPDREKYIDVLSKAEKTVKEFNEDTPIKISLESIEDILELLKEQPKIVRCGECRHGYRCEDDMKCENENQPAMCGQHFPEDWYCAAGERAEAGAEDPEDREGNNGPLKRIDPADVMDGLRRLAGRGVLGEHWREILADAMTLLWLRYER